MARKTTRELSRLFGIKVAATPGYVPEFKCSAVAGNKNLKFTATVKIDANEYTVAADGGTVKVFQNVDDFLKVAAKACEAGNGVYTVTSDTGALLASSVPSNMQTWAEGQITRLGKVKVNQTEVIAKLDAQLLLMTTWATGNAAQQARLIEVTAQKAAVNEDIAAIDTELARLALIAA